MHLRSGVISVHGRAFASLLCVAVISSIGGCATELPVYPWRDVSAALSDLQTRSESVRFASGSGTMTLQRSDGESVQVECAFAMALPDRLRIRSWKFNRAIADWTVLPQGTWIWQDGDASDSQTEKLREIWSSSCTTLWPVLFGQSIRDPGSQAADLNPHQFEVRQQCGDQQFILLVNKRHLVIEECRIETRQGKSLSVIRLEDYHLKDEIPWPGRVTATVSGASFRLECQEVSINEPLAPAAFRAPRRAEKVR